MPSYTGPVHLLACRDSPPAGCNPVVVAPLPSKVLEIAPPWVRTDLLGSNNEPRAMPLADFIEETMRVLGTDAEEVLVERAKPLRNNAGPGEAAFVTQFNDMMAGPK